MSYKLSNVLFGFSQEIAITGNVLKTGMEGVEGLGLSPARPATARTNKAKLNNGAWVLDLLFNGKIAALTSGAKNSVYVETTMGNVFKGLCTNELCEFDAIPSLPTAQTLPFVIRALTDETNFPYTRQYFVALKEELLKNGGVLGNPQSVNLFAFCDSLYYEWKAVEREMDINDALNLNQVKQAIRTGELEEIDIFEGIEMAPLNIDATVQKEKKDEVITVKDAEKFEDCKAGKYKIDYVWDGDRRKYIPSLDNLNEFVPSESFFTMLDLATSELGEVKKRMETDFLVDYEAIKDNYVNAQFVGRPGTGKTTIADALGAALGMPVRVVINSKNTEEDTFQGMTKVQEGGFKFVETPFLDVYKNGGILLLEEFNLADPGVMMGALGQAIEKPFILLEDGYKEVRRHPLCVVIATMNTGTQGSREPSEALTSRMPHVFLLDDPEEGQFLEILQKKSGRPKSECNKVYSAYKKIINYLISPQINAEDVALSITLRHCLATLKQMSIGRGFKQAVRNTLIGTIAIKDVNLSNNVYENVVKTLKD